MITFKVADRLIREAFYPSNKNHDLFEVDLILMCGPCIFKDAFPLDR